MPTVSYGWIKANSNTAWISLIQVNQNLLVEHPLPHAMTRGVHKTEIA